MFKIYSEQLELLILVPSSLKNAWHMLACAQGQNNGFYEEPFLLSFRPPDGAGKAIIFNWAKDKADILQLAEM